MATRSEILELVIRAKDAATKEVKGIAGAFKTGRDAFSAFNKEAKIGSGITSALKNQVVGLIGAFAGFQAIKNAVKIMQDADNAAFSMRTSVAAANREFNNVGSVESWERTIKDLSGELKIYSDTALKNAVSRTVDMTKRLGLSEEQMKEVIKRSADLGAGKVNLEGAIERVTAALRGEAESAEYLGLTLNENYVKAVYEADKANVKAWKDLTDLEKAQARYNVFLMQSAEFQGRAAASADTFSGAIAEIKKEITNAVANSTDLNNAMQNVAKVIKENAGEIGELISLLVTVAAKVVEFAVEWKNLLIIIAGTITAVNIITKLVGVVKGLNAAYTILAAKSVIAGAAMKGGIIAAAAAGVVSIGLLIKAIYDWRVAEAEAQKAQDRLIENSDRMMRKFEEFKDVKLPADITKLAQEDLEKLRQDLAKARAYYTALLNKMEDTGETKGLAEVRARLKEIQTDFDRVGESASSAAVEIEKPVKAVEATTEQLDEFEKQAKKAYEEATKQAADYAQKVIQFEEKIKYARMSTEDKIRELGRKGLDDATVWADKKLQAEEKLYAAKQAMARGDYEMAEKLAKDAEGLYADLATEVTSAGKDGKDVVVKSLEDTKEVAINGVKTVGTFVQELYTEQKNAAQRAHDEWQATADGINNQLNEIAKMREANVVIQLKQLAAAQSAINALIKPQYKDIYVRVHQQETKRLGGMAGAVRAALGRQLPGYGGGDIVDAKLEPGEYIIRKEAVRKYGAGLFEALNAMRVDAAETIKARIGGMISNISIPQPVYHFQAGGGVPFSSGETMTIRFQAGNAEMPLQVKGNPATTRQMVKNFEKELIKLGMVTR
jgi:hypothetical protein